MGEFHGNQHTGSPYDDYTYEDLVEDVAKLAEELGEAPTRGMQMRTAGFPRLHQCTS